MNSNANQTNQTNHTQNVNPRTLQCLEDLSKNVAEKVTKQEARSYFRKLPLNVVNQNKKNGMKMNEIQALPEYKEAISKLKCGDEILNNLPGELSDTIYPKQIMEQHALSSQPKPPSQPQAQPPPPPPEQTPSPRAPETQRQSQAQTLSENDRNLLNSSRVVNELYDGLTYFDLYGSSVFVFFLLSFIVFFVCSYCYVMINIQPIKDDWVNQRCNPKVIPFAGLINKPDDGTSVSDFTSENFNYCIQNILTDVTGYAVQPITGMTDALTSLYSDLADSVDSIRKMLSNLRTQIGNIAKQIMGKILNVLSPLQIMFLAFVDSMKKTQAILVSGLYTSLGTYYILQSLSGAIVEFIVKILIILGALIAGLWMLPVTWGAAAVSTSIYLAISIPTAIIVATLSEVLHVHSSAIPKLKCFDETTQLTMNDGSRKTIKDACVGDILENNNKITAKIQVCSNGSTMYNLNGVIVSDSHMVKHAEKWMRVSEHPLASIVPNYEKPYLYCLNTSTKEIIINNTIFTDWDELYEGTLQTILNLKINDKSNPSADDDTNKINNTIRTPENIHAHLCGGFSELSAIKLQNNTCVPISKILPGDVLNGGDIVYGIVEMDGSTFSDTNVYNLGDSFSACGKINLAKHLKSTNLLKIAQFNSILNISKKRNTTASKKVFHLLTDSGVFNVGSFAVNDYNFSIDTFI